VDLHIEIAYPFLGLRCLFNKKFKPLLGWIKSLESLVIIPHGDPAAYVKDPFIPELLKWMFLELEQPPRPLKRIWILEVPRRNRSLSIEHFTTTPYVKALNLWTGDDVRTELDHPKFSQMEQVGGICFSNNLAQMTQLKFAIGRCLDDHVIR